MCDRLAVIYDFFVYTYTLCASVWSEKGHFCICLFCLSKNITYVCLLIILLYLIRAPEWLTSWKTLEFHSYVNLEVCYIFRKVPTNLWSLVHVQFFYVIYILVGINHVFMVTICSYNGLVLRFKVIVIWKLYLLNLYYIDILKLRIYEWLYSVIHNIS